jgi:hypothetical protein
MRQGTLMASQWENELVHVGWGIPGELSPEFIIILKMGV